MPAPSYTPILSRRNHLCVLRNVPERPWNERRNVVTELWLSAQLRPYGIKPRILRLGEDRGRGYMRADFEEVFARYVGVEGNEPRMDGKEGEREKLTTDGSAAGFP